MMCANCRYFDEHSAYALGTHRCKLSDAVMKSYNDCGLTGLNMSLDAAIKVLHDTQKWRRGGKGKMVDPHVTGLAIDRALRDLRWLRKHLDIGGATQNG